MGALFPKSAGPGFVDSDKHLFVARLFHLFKEFLIFSLCFSDSTSFLDFISRLSLSLSHRKL